MRGQECQQIQTIEYEACAGMCWSLISCLCRSWTHFAVFSAEYTNIRLPMLTKCSCFHLAEQEPICCGTGERKC